MSPLSLRIGSRVPSAVLVRQMATPRKSVMTPSLPRIPAATRASAALTSHPVSASLPDLPWTARFSSSRPAAKKRKARPSSASRSMAASSSIQPSTSGPKMTPKPSMSTTSATGRRRSPTSKGVAAAMAAMTSRELSSRVRALPDAVAMRARRSFGTSSGSEPGGLHASAGTI